MTDLQDPLVPAGGRAIPNEPEHDGPPPLEPPAPAARTNGQRKTKPERDLLPHDLQAERHLLGAALLGAHHALADLPDGAFYAPAHGHIAHAIRQVLDQAGHVDAVTISDQLRRHDLLDHVGGPQALAELLAACPASSAAPSYARIVHTHWRTRQLIHASYEIAHVARGQGPDAAFDLLRPLIDANTPTAAALAWEDVGAVIRGEYEPMRPTILNRSDGQALIYPGLLHWLMGEPGKGKTWIALAVAAEQLLNGCHVLYLDWEGNRQIVGERLTALGVTHQQVDEQLHYLRPPAITTTIAAAIADVCATQQATVAILDGVAKALARNDFNEDKAPDVLAWLELLVTPITNAGTAVVCLDHVVKDKDTRGSWARGSGAKIGEVSGASWMVKPRTAFSRTTAGELDLIQTKDREGHVGIDGNVVATIRIVPQNEGAQVTIHIEPPAVAGGLALFRPTGYMQQICSAVASLTEADIPATTNKLFEQVPGKTDHKRVALQRLIEEGFVGITPGPRRAIYHHVIAPYFELEDPRSDRYSPTDGPPPEALQDPPVWEDF